MRNRIARLELTPSQGVGGVVLLDERWKRRTAGILGSPGDEADQPLLAERYFLAKALSPYADLREGPIDDLTQGPLSLLVVPDTGRIDPGQRAKLEAWMDKGGVLLRFAGPRLAASGDELVPVPLRQGDRMLGGALTWQQPLKLAPFDPDGPFAGLPTPEDARVSRQVLAEPSPHLSAATWPRSRTARRLITQARHGKGLAHPGPHLGQHELELAAALGRVRRHAAPDHGPGARGRRHAQGLGQPSMVLDAFGRLAPFKGAIPPIPAESLAATPPAPDHPPGLYGAGTRRHRREREQPARLALNLQPARPPARAARPRDAGPDPVALRRRALSASSGPGCSSVALLLALADLLIGYVMRGLAPRLRGPATAAAVALLLLHAWLGPAAGGRGRRPAGRARERDPPGLRHHGRRRGRPGQRGRPERADPRPRAAHRGRGRRAGGGRPGQGRAGPVPAALLADPARPPRPARPRPCAASPTTCTTAA